MPTWDDRLPFLGSSGRTQIQKRFQSCNASISRDLKLSAEQLAQARMLGCGNYGCTYLVPGLPSDRNILKITSDNLEAHVVNLFVSYPGDPPPPGIVHYEGIWLLGKCAVLPRMKPFIYRPARITAYPVRWMGEGAPYRPAWLIQREELPDIGPELKRLGISQKKVKEAIFDLFKYARQLFYDAGIVKTGNPYGRVNYDDLEKKMASVHGLALLEAIDWLAERQIAFLDFQKLENLGWREGTGLVIRDIGFSSNDTDLEPPQTIDGLRRWSR